MNPTLTLQEEELARNLKSQGKSTQEIMSAIAQSRTAKITPPREVVERQAGVFSRVLKDIPSDFMEMSRGVRSSVAQSSQGLRETFQDPDATLGMKLAATGPQLGKSVLDVAGEAIVGYGKMLTTDEFEKAVTQKIGETGQKLAGTDTAKALVAFRENLPPQSRFVLDKIIAPLGEVVFEASTVGGGTAATQGIKRAGEEIIEQAGKSLDDVTTGLRQADEVIVAPLPPEIKSNIVQGFDTAIKPNLASKQTPVQRARYESQVSQAVESIANNVENLKLVDDATGEVISKLPENLKEFVDALEQTKQSVFRKYDDLAAQAGEMQARIDTVRIANSLDEIINSKSLKLSNPESIAYAQGVRDRLLSTRALTALDAQDVIRNYNNSLDAFYRNPTPEGLSRNAVDALVANQMRRALDEEIEALTGAQYQALKSEYAALKAIERDVMRAYNRDARKNAKGLIDFTDVFSGGQVISGILSFNPAAIAQGAGQKAIATAIKMVNDPNRKVKQIFQEAGRYRRPDAGPQAPTRRQLPPASSAFRSEVSTGAPVQVGGQTARGAVEPGLTERVAPGAVKQPAQTGALKKQAERFKSVESFVKAVENNPAWKKKFDEAGVTPKEIGEMVIGGGAALSLLYLLDEEDLGGMGFMVMGSILGGAAARKKFVTQIAKNTNEADLLEMASFTGAYKAGAYKTNKKGEMVVKETDTFTQAEAQKALNDALRRAEDFPVVSDATLKELSDVFDDVLKQAEGKDKGATPQTKALLEEARRYKSAEEFVKAQGKPFYHGSTQSFDEFLPVSPTENLAGKAGTFFTTNPVEALGFGKNVKTAYLSKDASIKKVYAADMPADVRAEKIFEARREGYDAVELRGTKLLRGNRARLEQAKKRRDELKPEIDKLNEKLLAGEITAEHNLSHPLMKEWGEILAEINPTHTVVFKTDKVITQERLEAIWKQANQ